MSIPIGLIGAGRWGRNYIRTIRQLEGIHIAHIASRNPETVAFAGRKASIHDDWRALLDTADIDGLIIACPASVQADICVAAVSREVPLMVQKPLALSLEDAHRIADAVASREVPVLVDHTLLFHPAYEALRDIVGGGSLKSFSSEGWSLGPFRPDVSPLWDWAPHDLAFAVDLSSACPKLLGAVELEHKNTSAGLKQLVRIELSMSGGAAGVVIAGNSRTPKHRRLKVELFDGTRVEFDDRSETPLVIEDASGKGVVSVAAEQPLTRAIQTFAAGIRGSSRERFGLELAVNVVGILAEIDEQLGKRCG